MQAVLTGEPVDFLYESVRLFVLCDAMRFANLPVAGGIYDQHPVLIDEWQVLFGLKAEDQNRRIDEAKTKTKEKSVPPRIR